MIYYLFDTVIGTSSTSDGMNCDPETAPAPTPTRETIQQPIQQTTPIAPTPETTPTRETITSWETRNTIVIVVVALVITVVVIAGLTLVLALCVRNHYQTYIPGPTANTKDEHQTGSPPDNRNDPTDVPAQESKSARRRLTSSAVVRGAGVESSSGTVENIPTLFSSAVRIVIK